MSIRNQFSYLPAAGLNDIAISAKELQRNGPLIAAELHVPVLLQKAIVDPHGQQATSPAPVTGMALIDSGASMTTVDEAALQALGVSPVGQTNVRTPSGTAQQLLYPAEILFTGMPGRHTFAMVLGSPHLAAQNLLALIGRDVLGRAIFVYNGVAGVFTLAF